MKKKCSICFENQTKYIKLTCQHELCNSCWESWSQINPTCPLCRSNQEQFILANKTRCQIITYKFFYILRVIHRETIFFLEVAEQFFDIMHYNHSD